MRPASVTVHQQGTQFAVFARVRRADGHRIHDTRDYPHGYRAQARQAAVAWAEEHGYTVDCSE